MRIKNFVVSVALFFAWMVVVYFIIAPESDPRQVEAKSLTENSIKNFTTDTLKNKVVSRDPFPVAEAKYLRDTVRIFKTNNQLLFQEGLVSKISQHLAENPSKKVIITGLFNVFEKEEQGLERAKIFADSLIFNGITEKQLEHKALNINFDYNDDKSYSFGVLINYENLPLDEYLGNESSNSEFPEKIMRLAFGQTNFEEETLYDYVDSLKIYLKDNPNKEIHIYSHTDSIGDTKANEWISLKRGQSIKNYLVALGILSKKIKVHAMGETKPEADNGTREGRQINRRVEITTK